MKIDLFGNYHQSEPKKSFEEEYAAYINSAAWKRIRDAKIQQVGGKCERCGISKWSSRLEVHHKSYDHFKRERMEDLEVLCPKCHAGADEEREIEVVEHRKKSPLYIGFENWMDRGKNQGWRRMSDTAMARCWQQFLKELSHTTKRKYDIPFRRLDDWY